MKRLAHTPTPTLGLTSPPRNDVPQSAPMNAGGDPGGDWRMANSLSSSGAGAADSTWTPTEAGGEGGAGTAADAVGAASAVELHAATQTSSAVCSNTSWLSTLSLIILGASCPRLLACQREGGSTYKQRQHHFMICTTLCEQTAVQDHRIHSPQLYLDIVIRHSRSMHSITAQSNCASQE